MFFQRLKHKNSGIELMIDLMTMFEAIIICSTFFSPCEKDLLVS